MGDHLKHLFQYGGEETGGTSVLEEISLHIFTTFTIYYHFYSFDYKYNSFIVYIYFVLFLKYIKPIPQLKKTI